ncbi:MAG: hypothetical protein D4S01_01360 [Dehalococcoidia bacterium]|nr:MAG: hypothetical protein D4S01_01360 [Dehalococcoidia bacterium]
MTNMSIFVSEINVRVPRAMRNYLESIAAGQLTDLSAVVRAALMDSMPDEVKARISDEIKRGEKK